MKGVSKDGAGSTSTTEAGTFGLISFADVDSDNQKNDVVTFNGVTADVSSRPVISGAKNIIAAGLSQKLGEYYTLNFEGTNVITDAGATSYPSGRQDSGNAVEAGYINFLNGTDTTINMTQTSDGTQNYTEAAQLVLPTNSNDDQNDNDNTQTVAPHAAYAKAGKSTKVVSVVYTTSKKSAKAEATATKAAKSDKKSALPQTGEKKSAAGLLGLASDRKRN